MASADTGLPVSNHQARPLIQSRTNIGFVLGNVCREFLVAHVAEVSYPFAPRVTSANAVTQPRSGPQRPPDRRASAR